MDVIFVNHTTEHNLNAMVSRFNRGSTKEKYNQFLDSITLDENFCNLEYNTYEMGMKVFEYRIKWLTKNGHNEIKEYLETNRTNIPKEFKRVVMALCLEKYEEIQEIRQRLDPDFKT